MAESTKSLNEVPFSILAKLYHDLRSAKVGGNKRFRVSYAKARGESRRALLTNSWLKIAKFCGYGDSILAKRTADDAIVPAQIFPPQESFKLLCLLVPSLDSAHAYLGMKESKLADAFVKALDLNPNGNDAQWLKHHKEKEYRPQRWKQDADIVDGNFATVLKAVLTDRCPSESKLTIGDVWKALDSLSRASGGRGRSARIFKMPTVNPEVDPEGASPSQPWLQDTSSRPENAKSLTLRKVVQLGTPTELAEIARIILKDVDIRLSEDSIFSWFHPGAKQHYTQIHDIHKLLKDCADPKFEVGEASVQVGKYASVMLTMRPSRKKLDVIAENLCGDGDAKAEEAAVDDATANVSSISTVEKKPYFIMEPKLDGERMQLHKWRTLSEDTGNEEFEVRTFSRRGNDSSDMYAGALRDVVLSAILAQDIILDGEIMIWDDLKSSWLRFEDIREVCTSIAKKSVPEGASYTLKYMVFDVLYVDQGSKRKGDSRRDGNMVIRLPLFQRRRLLAKLIREKELQYCIGAKARIEIVGMERGHDEKELVQALQRYETLGYEGVIAKHPDRPYVLAERNLDISIKLKPDYFDGGIADLDVLILGAKYSASRGHRAQRAGRLSSFLIGVRASDINSSMWQVRGPEWEDRLKNTKWIPVGSVGTGYSDVELAEIQNIFKGEWKDFDHKDLPEHFEDRDYASTLLSEVAKWIEPSKSVVLTIRAFELNRRYGALRFPRVERINWEKPYYDVPTYNHLLDLDDNKQPALIRADENDVDEVMSGPAKKKSKKVFDLEEEQALQRVKEEGHLVTGGRSARSVIASAKGADVSNIGRICSVFEGLTFFVVGADANPKEAAEVKIHQLGGYFVQNFGSKVAYVICTSFQLARIKTMAKKFGSVEGDQGTCSIIHSHWVDECFTQKCRTIPNVNDVVYATGKLEAELFEYADRFGDGWEKGTTAEMLRLSIGEVEKWKRKNGDNCERVETIEEKIKDLMKTCGNVFWGMVIRVARDESRLRGCFGLIEGLGGRVVEREDDNVTHVLVHSSMTSEWKEENQEGDAVLVTEEWVQQIASNAQI